MRLPGMRLRSGAQFGFITLAAMFTASAAAAWNPLPVDQDPLVRMPGSQPADGIVIESPAQCSNCHGGYDKTMEPTFAWAGSMMSQALRDPLFWAAVTVATQDSISALGRPNGGDLCLRCHSPTGWLGHRSDPSNGSALTGTDHDGVTCDLCHSMYDPFFELTFAGTREGSDWSGYWDEATAASSTAALQTRTQDRTESASVRLFNGTAFYDASFAPHSSAYTENGGGQFFVGAAKPRRGPFVDAAAKHQIQYSRYHKSRYFCSSCHDVSNSALANINYAATPPGDGTTVLPSEQVSAYSYGHIERTFSEFRLSGYGQLDGVTGEGPFAPGVFKTSHPGSKIASCQDCHMADRVGVACNKAGSILRPTGSSDHPQSGLPYHDLTGGNAFVTTILASTVAGLAGYDATNASLLRQGAAKLTLDLTQGEPLDPAALLDAAQRAVSNIQKAASIVGLTYDRTTGALSFRVRNNTGHKLLSGYPEGRRMFVNVRSIRRRLLGARDQPIRPRGRDFEGSGAVVFPSEPRAVPGRGIRRRTRVRDARQQLAHGRRAHVPHRARRFALQGQPNSSQGIPRW